MRILVNPPSSSIPVKRRLHPGTDLRCVRHPYDHPPPSSTAYYPSAKEPEPMYVDPYRALPFYWRTAAPAFARQPYSYRRHRPESRLLSQRLWEFGSDDDDDSEKDSFNKHCVHV